MDARSKLQTTSDSGSAGFTLVELLLSVAASSVILAVSISLLVLVQQSRSKVSLINEVERNGLQVAELISRTVRDSTSIQSPAQGTGGETLSLNMANAAVQPTTFDSLNGAIRITEGAQQSLALTSSRVVASGVTFANLSRTGSRGSVFYQFTLFATSTSGRSEFAYEQTFSGSSSVRP